MISDVNGKLYEGFLLSDKDDKLEVALYWETHFEWALKKHNRT